MVNPLDIGNRVDPLLIFRWDLLTTTQQPLMGMSRCLGSQAAAAGPVSYNAAAAAS